MLGGMEGHTCHCVQVAPHGVPGRPPLTTVGGRGIVAQVPRHPLELTKAAVVSNCLATCVHESKRG